MALLIGDDTDNNFIGTGLTDFISGGSGNDTLLGLEGNDTLYGDQWGKPNTGDDSLSGGDGNDVLSDFAGIDTIDGGAGSDTMEVNYYASVEDVIQTYDFRTGSGTITDGAGNSVTYTSIESFELYTGSGNDFLFGLDLNDTLASGAGNDTLSGNGGDDSLSGDSGNDILLDFEGIDTLNGGAGTDTLSINYGASTGNVIQTVDAATDSGTITDSSGNVATYSGVETFVILSGAGNDFLLGGSSSDSLTGGAGNDTLSGFNLVPASSTISQVDTLSGGSGNDTFVGGASSNPYYTQAGTADYALFQDFSISEDVIQLTGSSDQYTLGSSPISGISGTAIYQDGDLVAVVQDTTGLDLSASYVVYV
jgi:Ca2+-binding RTX toxin-like protein